MRLLGDYKIVKDYKTPLLFPCLRDITCSPIVSNRTLLSQTSLNSLCSVKLYSLSAVGRWTVSTVSRDAFNDAACRTATSSDNLSACLRDERFSLLSLSTCVRPRLDVNNRKLKIDCDWRDRGFGITWHIIRLVSYTLFLILGKF